MYAPHFLRSSTCHHHLMRLKYDNAKFCFAKVKQKTLKRRDGGGKVHLSDQFLLAYRCLRFHFTLNKLVYTTPEVGETIVLQFRTPMCNKAWEPNTLSTWETCTHSLLDMRFGLALRCTRVHFKLRRLLPTFVTKSWIFCHPATMSLCWR